MRLLQSGQPLPRILNLSYPRVSVLPEVEEFLVVLYGFGFQAFGLLIIIPNSFSSAVP